MFWLKIVLLLFLISLMSIIFYKQFFKRLYDFITSLILIILFSPLLFALTILGTFFMDGRPFFVQVRPGKDEKLFKILKFRSMIDRYDGDGNLLPDEKRVNKYGLFLRSTSLDELPQLFNILIGNESFVGPRPLLVEYIDLYSEEQHHRHDVKPGLTGLAQVNGRNRITWEQKFNMDIYYVNNISLLLDLKILFKTIVVVLKKQDISQENQTTVMKFNPNELKK